MADQKKIVIVGGHGKIALLAAPKLTDAGYTVDSIIRNPDHRDDVAATGANPVLLDIESADTDALAEAFTSAEAVVFSAGAGGGNPDRTRAVDHDAAIRTMDAAEKAGVRRYVMVSYISAAVDVHSADKESSFYPYAEAKHLADKHLTETDLEYTILGPAKLTSEPASKKIITADEAGAVEGSAEPSSTSRENVAEVIRHVLANGAGVRQRINFYDGETPIADAIS
ncbi:SDR family oxidoreductase [Garicola koreensis]|uniref:Uncharacterized protein YbjT (DUF2867 family) n=1 Tax=Garicola koreensis TaxID=1262554 RepID=A0A7W5Y0L4_9MICC|nr:SDR family oxidoreductase [Garicola koreensis]MBB3668511.1 uncharacterized protein YbjT (DUF2867 family) [Garicola koreensis]